MNDQELEDFIIEKLDREFNRDYDSPIDYNEHRSLIKEIISLIQVNTKPPVYQRVFKAQHEKWKQGLSL